MASVMMRKTPDPSQLMAILQEFYSIPQNCQGHQMEEKSEKLSQPPKRRHNDKI